MLSYATHRRITPAQGTVECWVARSDGGSGTELLHLGAENAVERGLDVILDGDKLTLNVAQELRLATPAAALGEQWTHLAIVWDTEALRVYVGGRRVGTTPMDEALRRALADAAGPKGLLRFGSLSDYAGEAHLRVDEVRVSSVSRYHGDTCDIPLVLFSADEETLFLDALEVAFTPDGEDARTPAGGCPSVGCTVVPGRFGQTVQIDNAPPRAVEDLVHEYKPDLALLWNWRKSHFRTQSEWPPEFFQSVPDNLESGIAARQALGLPTIAYVGYPAIAGHRSWSTSSPTNGPSCPCGGWTIRRRPGVRGYNDMARKVHRMRNAYQSFGTTTAEWTPYFKSQPTLIAATDPNIKVSVYHHPGKDALLFVMNMNPADGVYPVSLKRRALGLDHMTLKVENALTGVPIAVDPEGGLQIPVRGKSFIMVRID
jgi:hypothetical protein